ncbi:Uncharacterised protein r2_g4290 [Pycnogonum litorale]
MTDEQIIENIRVIIDNIHKHKPPKSTWPFVTRIITTSPQLPEKFDINPKEQTEEPESEEDEEASRLAESSS